MPVKFYLWQNADCSPGGIISALQDCSTEVSEVLASQTAVRILPQTKLNSQLSCCELTQHFHVVHPFFKSTVRATDKVTQSGLPSLAWTPRGTGALVPAAAPCTHPPPRGIQTNLGKSLLVLKSHILVEMLSFIWQWSRLPAPSKLEMLGR